MIKVSNQKTISNLAKATVKFNKLRNVFAIVGIILTTVLFTSVFTISMNMIDSMEESTMRQVGGSSHGGFKYLTEEQYNKLKDNKSIKEIHYTVVLGNAENKELIKRPTEIRYASSDREAELMFSKPTAGRMPEDKGEIAVDTIVLNKLGVEPKLGEKVTLEYSIHDKKHKDTFTLVGFWKGDKVMKASQAWLSKDYIEEKLEGYVPNNEYDFIGRINADINFSNKYNIEDKLTKVIEDSGYKAEDISIGVNWAYIGSGEVDMVSVVVIVGSSLLITLCGYLIISNIFYISIAKDIRSYGLLKTVGTTSRQIRKLVKKQALFLCIIGIPTGLVLGYLVGAILTPVVISITNVSVIKMSLNPLIFIGSALFALFTVLISVNKSAKMAGKVSPIEAIRSTDIMEKNIRKNTRKSGKASPAKIACSNVLRNKKKVVLVTLSLSLSLIMLNITFSAVNCFDMDKFLKGSIVSDFAVADARYFNVYNGYSNENTLTDEFLNELSSQNGVEEIGKIYFIELPYKIDENIMRALQEADAKSPFSEKDKEMYQYYIDSGIASGHLYGLDKMCVDAIEVYAGEIDWEKFKTGNYIIVSSFDRNGEVNYYNVGDKVGLDFEDGNIKEYEVMAVGNIEHSVSVRHSHPIDPNFYLPSKEFLKEYSDRAPMITILNTNDDSEDDMETYLKNYCNNVNDEMQYESKAVFEKEFENLQKTYLSVGLVLSFIIGFIGIMNFINTIATSVIARRRELAMLQSIGMTNSQLRQMLMTEGLMHAFLTLIFTLTIGSMLGYFGVNTLVGDMWFFTPHYTIIPVIYCVPIFIAIAILVPILCYKLSAKESIVERLREVE
ncbi:MULTISPECIES: ABC transporter permease [unclassified Sedimentibacter]|uniref:ABC transporter permease n=1 Tax=unclassified Sedimentibacter TaxID=2649220 RepID=UPI0027E109D4|nr:FtsX-like permease family protein [Sedimentibacter sp. MB35-C1]WMJ77502.1 FtsX-like permease family protein [Sedimentibacter sp. MB35-C1]